MTGTDRAKNLLTSKPDGHPLTGRRTGRKTSQKRYYAVSRALSHPGKDATLRKMIAAEPIEQAVISILQKVLTLTPDLTRRVGQAVDCCRRAMTRAGANLPKLLKDRAALQRKIEFALDELDAIGRDALRNKMSKLQSQVAALDEKIRQAQVDAPVPQDDPAAATARIVEHLVRLAGSLDRLPAPAVRRLLETVIERAVVDLETREVELSLRLPSWAVEHMEAMCLDETSACKPAIEAHPECAAVLVQTGWVWWSSCRQYLGLDFVA